MLCKIDGEQKYPGLEWLCVQTALAVCPKGTGWMDIFVFVYPSVWHRILSITLLEPCVPCVNIVKLSKIQKREFTGLQKNS